MRVGTRVGVGVGEGARRAVLRGGAAGSSMRTRAPPISQVRISRVPPYPEMRSWTMPSPSDARPGRAGRRPSGVPQPAPNPGPSSSTWMTSRPCATSTCTSTRPSATRHAFSRTFRTARHNATGSMCAHASPVVRRISCGVTSRIPVTTSAVRSSTRIRSGAGVGWSSSSSSRRSRWSSHRVSSSSWSMRARLVSPTSSATATAEASMMIVPSSCRMSCRSRRRHSACPPRSDVPVRSRRSWCLPSRTPVPASVLAPTGVSARENRGPPLFMTTTVRYSCTRVDHRPAAPRMSSRPVAIYPLCPEVVIL